MSMRSVGPRFKRLVLGFAGEDSRIPSVQGPWVRTKVLASSLRLPELQKFAIKQGTKPHVRVVAAGWGIGVLQVDVWIWDPATKPRGLPAKGEGGSGMFTIEGGSPRCPGLLQLEGTENIPQRVQVPYYY